MKKFKWVFYFEEGSIQSESYIAQEDERIRDFITNDPKGTLSLPGSDMEIWVNLDKVKCTTRQVLDEENSSPEVQQ
jgi:hypothetical protein